MWLLSCDGNAKGGLGTAVLRGTALRVSPLGRGVQKWPSCEPVFATLVRYQILNVYALREAAGGWTVRFGRLHKSVGLPPASPQTDSHEGHFCTTVGKLLTRRRLLCRVWRLSTSRVVRGACKLAVSQLALPCSLVAAASLALLPRYDVPATNRKGRIACSSWYSLTWTARF